MSHKGVATITHVGRSVPDAVAYPAIIERMKARMVVSDSGCWLWQGFTFDNGYGSISFRNKAWRVHRLSFVVHHGPIPRGHDICHTCDIRHCFNPDHLWSGPRGENNRDTRSKGRDNNSQKTHCPRGHEYAIHGRHVNAGFKGWRACRICSRARLRINSGWSAEEAYSIPRIPMNERTKRRQYRHNKQRIAGKTRTE